MPLCTDYVMARTIPEALQALVDARQPARIIAGGTDLLIDLQQDRSSPVHTLVDISDIEELNRLELRREELFIGSAVPMAKLSGSPLLQTHAAALVEACSLVGGPQVRNVATLGGNVAHALPAGDGSIALLALNADVEVAGQTSSYRIPIQDLFIAPGKSILSDRKEILTGFYIRKVETGDASAFQRVMRPQGVALPILNMAVWIKREQDRIADLRIAIGPAGQIPYRAKLIEQKLRGNRIEPEIVVAAMASLDEKVPFRTSPHRATREYRFHLAQILLSHLLLMVWNKAEITLRTGS